jgi:ATP-dependent DNA helicase RecQ
MSGVKFSHSKILREIGDKFSSKCAARIVEFTKSQPDQAYAVFTNTASASIKVHAAIKDALDSAGLSSDVVLVHGSLSPEEKSHLCRAFCDISMKSKLKSNTKGLVGTSSCDTGLDHMLLLFIILCELPRDLLSYIQRRGRAGRQGEQATCHLMASFQDFSFTAVQIESSIHSNQSIKHLTWNCKQ